MSKRLTEEERVMQFFESAPIDSCNTLITLAKGVVRRRENQAQPNAVPKTRRVRKSKAAAPVLPDIEVDEASA